MAAVYNYISFITARNQLANRLYDSGKVFWSDAELKVYIVEALRTWNAITSYWRGDFTFQSQAGVTYYDLTDAANLPNSPRLLTLFDTDIYTPIQYHLLEPVAWNPWTGVSLQFTADDVLNAVQRRRDELLSICGHNVTRRTIGAASGRTALPDTVLDVRRVAYLPSTVGDGSYGSGTYGIGPYGSVPKNLPTNAVVWPDDAWAEQSFDRNYTIKPAGTPLTYLLSTQPPISFDTDVPPAWSGNYELLTIEAGPLLSVSTPTHLATPDDWTHVIKWGALADLLSRESNAKDPARATYCEQRYRMGAKLLSDSASLLALRLNNVALQIDSVRNADLFRTGWQAQAQGTPDTALFAGLNLLALTPAPSTATLSLTATVVQNAPVPIGDSDPVQVSRDDLDTVIDYAQHLASFKMGGQEFLSTMPLFERFMKQAALYNSKISELGEYWTILHGLGQLEKSTNPIATAEVA